MSSIMEMFNILHEDTTESKLFALSDEITDILYYPLVQGNMEAMKGLKDPIFYPKYQSSNFSYIVVMFTCKITHTQLEAFYNKFFSENHKELKSRVLFASSSTIVPKMF